MLLLLLPLALRDEGSFATEGCEKDPEAAEQTQAEGCCGLCWKAAAGLECMAVAWRSCKPDGRGLQQA